MYFSSILLSAVEQALPPYGEGLRNKEIDRRVAGYSSTTVRHALRELIERGRAVYIGPDMHRLYSLPNRELPALARASEGEGLRLPSQVSPRNSAGVSSQVAPAAFSEEIPTAELIRELAADGMSDEEIGEHFGRTKNRRAAQCRTCQGARTIKVNGKTVRCYECRGKVEGGKVIPAKRTKYGAVRTTYSSVQGFTRTYDSKGEARHAELLDGGIRAGLVIWWLPQITIPLQGGVKYRADFQVMWADGRLVFQDFKGADTQASINKRKQVAEGFGITVELVRK